MKQETPEQLLMTVLHRAIGLMRPHGSVEEGSLLLSLAFDVRSFRPNTPMFVDPAGNLHVDMRAFDKRGRTPNTTLFVAHVDTVHRRGGVNVYDCTAPIWKAAGRQQLGADDGAGVAVLSALIRSGKPAYYIFTRGEECGGIGSKYLADEMPDVLEQFDRAVAFDRKDVFSIITHQGMGRCCSDAFAEALCTGLNDLGMMMMPDDTGIYTDTAEFVDFIPECTNISAGYYREHSQFESLDVTYLQQLAAAAIALDWDAMPVVREAGSWGDDDTDDLKYPDLAPTVPFKEAAKGMKDLKAYLEARDADDARKAAAKAIVARASTPGVTQAEIDAAWDRWEANDRPKRATTPGPVEPDDPFAWSEDGQTFHTGTKAMN